MPTRRTTMADYPLLRLMHIASSTLPTGAFAYSQGLEWAVSAGWIRDAKELSAWLEDSMKNSLSTVDIPVLIRLIDSFERCDESALAKWSARLLAMRETRELRAEERQRGQAMLRLLEGLGVPFSEFDSHVIRGCQLAGYAKAADHWKIPKTEAATGYVWSWLENQVLSGIKLIPIGQTEGHRILSQLDATITVTVLRGLDTDDDAIGASNPALAIASSCHETQYTRLYRS